MEETDKLRFLWRGNKPSVMQKLLILKPTTCDRFLEEVKRLEKLMSRSEEWALGVLGKITPPSKEVRMNGMLEGLLGTIAVKKNPPLQGLRVDDTQHKPAWHRDDRNLGNLNWTSDGRPVCGRCGTEGQIKKECSRTPDGQQIVCYGCGGVGHIIWMPRRSPGKTAG
jgi:hypothetical protein